MYYQAKNVLSKDCPMVSTQKGRRRRSFHDLKKVPDARGNYNVAGPLTSLPHGISSQHHSCTDQDSTHIQTCSVSFASLLASTSRLKMLTIENAHGLHLRGSENDGEPIQFNRELSLFEDMEQGELDGGMTRRTKFHVTLNLTCKPEDMAGIMLATLRTAFMDQNVEFLDLKEDLVTPSRGRRLGSGGYGYTGYACTRCKSTRELIEGGGEQLTNSQIISRMKQALKIAFVDTLGKECLRTECLHEVKEDAFMISPS